MRAEDLELVGLVRSAAPHVVVSRSDSEVWLDRLEARASELNALVDDAAEHDPQLSVELVCVLWHWWWLRGRMSEGRERLVRVAALPAGARSPEVWKGLGTIAFRQGDVDAARNAFAMRLELLGDSPEGPQLVDAYADLARIALRQGDFVTVQQLADLGYEAAIGLDESHVRMPLHMRAAAARMLGRLEDARALYLESRDLAVRLGNEVMVACEDHNLVYVALHAGDRAEAMHRFQLSSSWIFEHENAYLKPYAFVDAAVLAAEDGDASRAALLLGCAKGIFEDTQSIPDPDDWVEVERLTAHLGRTLGDTYPDLEARGRALHPDEAQKLATAGNAGT